MALTFNTALSIPSLHATLFEKSRHAASIERPALFAEKRNTVPNVLNAVGRNDVANAQRLALFHGGEFRYCPAWDMFLVWDGWRWIADDCRHLEYLAQLNALGMFTDDPEIDNCPSSLAFAKYSCSHVGIANTLALVRADPHIHVTPEQLDANPMLWNTRSGTICLKDGSLDEHRPADYCWGLSGQAYDPDAQCPLWESFLRDALGNNLPLIRYVQRALGYTLTADIGEALVFVCHGPDSFYKNAFLEIVAELLGQDYGLRVRLTELEALQIRPGGADMPLAFGRRGVIANGPLAGQRTLTPEALLPLLDRHSVQLGADLLHRWQFRPAHKLWLAAGSGPDLEGPEKYDLRQKVSCIPFTAARPEPNVRRRLLCDLAIELPGIMNWCLEGAMEGMGYACLQEPLRRHQGI